MHLEALSSNGPLKVGHAAGQEGVAPVGIVLRTVSEQAYVGWGDEIKALYRQPFLLQRSNHPLHIPIPDHPVCPRVEVHLRPGRRSLHHGIIVVLVEVFGHRVQDDPKQDHHHSKQSQEEAPQQHVDVWAQCGLEGTKSSSHVLAPWRTVHNRAHYTQRTELLMALQELHHVAVEHEATIAEHMEEYRVVLHLIVIQYFKQFVSSASELLVSKRFRDEYRLQRRSVVYSHTSLKQLQKRSKTYTIPPKVCTDLVISEFSYFKVHTLPTKVVDRAHIAYKIFIEKHHH